MWCVKCRVSSVKCRVSSVKCKVWSVKFKLWSVKRQVWSIQCDVWFGSLFRLPSRNPQKALFPTPLPPITTMRVWLPQTHPATWRILLLQQLGHLERLVSCQGSTCAVDRANEKRMLEPTTPNCTHESKLQIFQTVFLNLGPLSTVSTCGLAVYVCMLHFVIGNIWGAHARRFATLEAKRCCAKRQNWQL